MFTSHIKKLYRYKMYLLNKLEELRSDFFNQVKVFFFVNYL